MRARREGEGITELLQGEDHRMVGGEGVEGYRMGGGGEGRGGRGARGGWGCEGAL